MHLNSVPFSSKFAHIGFGLIYPGVWHTPLGPQSLQSDPKLHFCGDVPPPSSQSPFVLQPLWSGWCPSSRHLHITSVFDGHIWKEQFLLQLMIGNMIEIHRKTFRLFLEIIIEIKYQRLSPFVSICHNTPIPISILIVALLLAVTFRTA
jgi:hypothetical protein